MSLPVFVRLSIVLLLITLASATLKCTAATPDDSDDAPDQPACFDAHREHLHQRLATKTPYRFVANTDESPPAYPGCRPTRIWTLIRHGTRHPNRRILRSLSSRLLEVRDRIVEAQQAASAERTLCARDQRLFELWSRAAQLQEPDEMQLAAEGHDELVLLAERMQMRFPELMPDVYRNESYRFKFTDSQRTRKSFEAFATGLFGRNNIQGIWHPEPSKRDPILRFYKLCQRWSHEVDKNPAAVAEADAFRRSQPVLDAMRRVSQRAGMAGELSESDVHLMYTLCAFETAWERHEESPWCTLFDAESARVFEYLEDLEYYYVDGYGTPLTYRQACPALNDMLQRLTGATADQPAATFYFTHSGTILKMLALLGLYRDAEPLRHDGYADGAEERRWRVSRIDAFASNLAFVAYNCTSAETGTTSAHILVQHQERTVRLDGCPTDADLCPLAMFRSIHRHSLDDECRFDEMCALSGHTEL